MSLGCVVDTRAFISAENGAGDPKLFPGLCSGAPKQTLKTTRRRKKQRSHRSSRKHAVGDRKGGKVRGSKCKQLTSDGSWRLVLSHSALHGASPLSVAQALALCRLTVIVTTVRHSVKLCMITSVRVCG